MATLLSFARTDGADRPVARDLAEGSLVEALPRWRLGGGVAAWLLVRGGPLPPKVRAFREHALRHLRQDRAPATDRMEYSRPGGRVADEAGRVFRQRVDRLRTEIGRIIVGQQSVVDGVLTCLVADGHVLLEGVPGLGKTLLVRTLAGCLGLHHRRIQFTPDLMPADILGTQILEEGEDGRRRIRFQEGPVFTQLLLADEINRATPKTQSALLEAMQERQVTVAGERRALPGPFFVMATQNPLEQEGTYPLPEAQLDRFFFKVLVPFPTLAELETVMARTTGTAHDEVSPVLGAEELAEMRRTVREVTLVPEILRYALRLVLATQPDGPGAGETARKYLKYGASPRGAQTLVLGAKVRALLEGRPHVSIADVRAVALPALRHRIGRSFEAESEGLSADALVERVLAEVPEVTGPAARELRA